MNKTVYRALVAIVSVAAPAISLFGSTYAATIPWSQVARLPGDSAGDQFGTSVSLQQNRMLVGALQGDGAVADSGAAYIYQGNGASWTRTAKLAASDGVRFDNFGASASLDGSRAAVGADSAKVGTQTAAGAAYIYESNGGAWNQKAKLVASDAGANDRFGSAISVRNERVVVGATEDSYSGISKAGSAYIFDQNAPGNWTQSAKLTPSSARAGARFGESVSQDGDRVVVGSPYWGNPALSRSGAAYVFEKYLDEWSEVAQLTAADTDFTDDFGQAVAIDGDRILVGAPTKLEKGQDRAGAAYIFELHNNSWVQTAKLIELDPHQEDFFGFAVALEGNRAVIGAPGRSGATGHRGAAYVFELANGTWTQVKAIEASDSSPNAAFGEAVGLSGDMAAIGARLADQPGITNNGGVYLYVAPEPSTWILTLSGLVALFAGRRMTARRSDGSES